MRASRTLIVALALALLAFLPTGTAQAKPSADAAKAPASERATKVGFKIIKKGGKLFAVGNTKPAAKKVVIQKATNCGQKSCNFKFYRNAKTKDGRFKVRVYAPKSGSWAWRARVGTNSSDIWVTCRRATPSSPCPNP